jgi:hypothetical protein
MTKFSHPLGYGLKEAGLPIIPVMVGDYCISFIVDTGSTISLIDKDVAEKLGELVKIKDESCFMLSVGGTYKQVKQKAALNFILNEIPLTQEFFCESLYESLIKIEAESNITVHGILDNDFLLKNRWIIDFEKLEVVHNNKKI